MKKIIAVVCKNITDEILAYYSSFNNEITQICVVSPCIGDEWKVLYPVVTFYEDRELLCREDYSNIEKTSRPNWYFQQFLKYNIVLKLHQKQNFDWVHIVDGDTFLRKEMLLDEALYYTSKKIEAPYQDFIALAALDIPLEDKNFITNQMLYRASYLQEMLTEISGDRDWIEVFIHWITQYPNVWFSEYQLYAVYVKYKYAIAEKPMKIFRRYDLVKVSLEQALKKYDAVAQEFEHKRSILHRIRAKIYYCLGLNLG